MIKVGINGFGRIGRIFTRRLIEDFEDSLVIVGINDPSGAPEAMAHLLEFDSVQGRFAHEVAARDGRLIVKGHSIPIFHKQDPRDIPWRSLNPDVILEGSGRFKTREESRRHIDAGAPRVLVSAVSDEDVNTIVLGANQSTLDGSEDVISNASCTTNSAAPLVDIIDSVLGIESGYITTVHSYTGDQSLHDRMHVDLRRARAAALSIIPTTTGAAKAITRIFPHLDGALGGAGIRVPVPNASLTDMTFIVKKDVTVDQVNELFRNASREEPWKGYLEYTEKPLVSSDIIGNTHSCIFDALLTSVIGKMVKVVGWYDNETGYSTRLCELILYWSKLWDSNQKPEG